MENNNGVQAGYGITHTLEETAKLLGITRERVRQLQKKVLATLRTPSKIKYIEGGL